MENHPIPQDVTGFKFKLIGSITLKEFLYILAGGILAVIVFILPGLSYFVKVPLMAIFGGIGASLAFIPIEGRPMDKMIYNFIKTVPSENEYLYHKKGVVLTNYEFFTPLQTPQATVAQQTQTQNADTKRNLFYSQLTRKYKADQDELSALAQVRSYFNDSTIQAPQAQETNPSVAVVHPAAVPPQDASAPVFPTHDVEPVKRTATITDTSLEDSIHPLIETDRKPVSTQPDSGNPIILNAPSRVHITPEELAQQKIRELAKNAPAPLPGGASPLSSGEEFQFRQQPTAAPAPQTPQPLSPMQAKIATGFPSLPDKPNIILGIVKDPRGKVLQNILVEVLDSNGLSVRAFKTNALGQFASATPLSNGKYTVLFNDPQQKHEFSKIVVTLDGTIFQPIEVRSIDAREKLRQELFGRN